VTFVASHLSSLSDERDDLLERGAMLLSWRWDRRGGCDFVSEGWLAFTGRGFEDTLADGWNQSIHSDDRDFVATARHAAIRRQGPFEVAYRLRRQDGVYRLVLDRAIPRFDGEGGFQGFVGSTVDITDRLDMITRVAQHRSPEAGATTVCTACNMVHSGDGHWQRLETWIAERFDAALRRGLCPECETRWERGA